MPSSRPSTTTSVSVRPHPLPRLKRRKNQSIRTPPTAPQTLTFPPNFILFQQPTTNPQPTTKRHLWTPLTSLHSLSHFNDSMYFSTTTRSCQRSDLCALSSDVSHRTHSLQLFLFALFSRKRLRMWTVFAMDALIFSCTAI